MRLRSFALALVALLMLVSPVAAQRLPVGTPEASPGATPIAACVELDAYFAAVLSLSQPDEHEMDVLLSMDGFGDPRELRPSQQRELAEIFDAWAQRLDEVPEDDIPEIARDYHFLLVRLLSGFASMMNALAAGNVDAVEVYERIMAPVSEDMMEEMERLEAMCGPLAPYIDLE